MSKDHEKKCPRFNIISTVTAQRIVGICNKCGEVLEIHERTKPEKLLDFVGQPLFYPVQ